MNIIIFTDLDDSLLNHDDYSFKEAIPSLEKIKVKNIPLIFTTSKTRKEVEIIQRQMKIKDPFIVENGGGIFFPHGYMNFRLNEFKKKDNYYVVELGKPYSEIRRCIEKSCIKYEIIGFGDMTAQAIARLTNLPAGKAELAKEREYTEPLMVRSDDYLNELKESASKADMKVTHGGRFYHLIGVDQDKGRAVKITKQIFEENWGRVTLTIGVGNGKNDLPMLAAVDIPILIPYPNEIYEDTDLPIVKARYPGSRGWNESILRVIDVIEKTGC